MSGFDGRGHRRPNVDYISSFFEKQKKKKKEKDGIKYEAKVVLSKDIYPVSDIEPPRLYRRVIYLIQAATP
ncbi:MAG: hypothetical protein ACTIKO_07640, partial [Psychrobacter sp.]|uniref:hypothetical protein n=1 Tax=Psychrobacter sp. TaxID=56811 RepID=UPI003F95863E